MILDALNAAVCLGAAWACLCRLAASHGAVVPSVRLHAALAIGSALVSAAAPVFGHPVTWPQLMLGATLFAGLALSTWRWRFGPSGDLIKRSQR